jgi:integrase
MRGHIYSDERCPLCGGLYVHDDHRSGLFCKKHPEFRATGRFRVKFGRKTRKRFSSYQEAERFLDGLRWEVDQGTFDFRDYQTDNPLGFSSQAMKWLNIKKKELKPKSFNNLLNYMSRAGKEWGQKNIKAIGYGEIEDFLFNQNASDKTKANMKSCLHSFFKWVKKREGVPMPDFPEVHYTLGWRQTISKETQQSVLDEVYRISQSINPKIWLGIKMLSTYISIRPGELMRIKEKEIDLESGFIFIPAPKEKKAKVVPLIPEDIDFLRQFPKGLPELPFFRHPSGVSGCKAGQQFGEKYLYKWWKKACSNLGVEGVDLYGGTRHSSALALRQFATPEQIKRATMHSTNKAFERYFRVETDELREIYKLTQGGPRVGHQKKDTISDKILNFYDKSGGGGGSRTRVRKHSTKASTYIA